MTPAITLYAVLVFLHVLAVVIWVGGMFVVHTAVARAPCSCSSHRSACR